MDAAHAQGLRVILDWPLNRSSRDNPLTTQHPAWFTHDPYGAITYAVPNRHAFAGFDFAQPALRHYLIDAMRSWLARFDFDGLRFDDSDLTPLDFLREIRTALAAARPEIVLISQSYDELHHLGACDLTYEGGMRELISQVAQGLAAPLQIQRYWEESTYSFPRGALRMRWLEEKEQDRAFRYYGHALHCAAATLLLTLDGVPCVLMGQEFNEPSWRSWESLFEPFVLDWSALDKTTFQHYRALIALRTRHPAMRCGAVTFVPSGADRVVRYWRSVNDERICVTVNLSDGLRTPAAQTEPCRTLYLHAPGAVSTGAGTLPPFGSLIERAGSQPADQ